VEQDDPINQGVHTIVGGKNFEVISDYGQSSRGRRAYTTLAALGLLIVWQMLDSYLIYPLFVNMQKGDKTDSPMAINMFTITLLNTPLLMFWHAVFS